MNKKLESTCNGQLETLFEIKTREDFDVYIQNGVTIDRYDRALLVPYYIEDFTMLMTIFLRGNVDEYGIIDALNKCVSNDPFVQMRTTRTIRFSCISPVVPDGIVSVEFKAHPFDVIQWCANYYK